jgi:hypothetical protein
MSCGLIEVIAKYIQSVLEQYPKLNGSVTLHFNNGKWCKSEFKSVDKWVMGLVKKTVKTEKTINSG